MLDVASQVVAGKPDLAPHRHGRAAQSPAAAVRTSAVYLLAEAAFDDIYAESERAAIATRVNACDELITPQHYQKTTATWPEVEIIFSGWGMVPMDDAFFRRFPKVKVVFYGAGTVRAIVTEAFWQRKIRLTNAASANAVPVSEFTLSQILFALKHGWRQAFYIREHRKFPPLTRLPGAYQTTVALLSLGAIGGLVADRLRQFDVKLIAYDPFVPPAEAQGRGIELVSLEEAFATADVVSCHTPLLPETEKMIRGRHLELMKPGSTFINTARGAIVHELEMIEVLRRRPDLHAVLDVTDPLPPPEGSPLFALNNVTLTPHIAGCLGPECGRMGRLMVEELDRYLAGLPLQYEIDRARFEKMA